ncbi:hypothetical protein Bbelb_347040 [Branchiostoma belcheri]|nr:hypothetical protein Bbelb_347040 [Branchiostoma belcheri]
MKTRNNKQSAVQAVLTIATKGRITFSPPVRKDEQTVHPPPSAEDAGGIGQRLRKRRSDAEGGETGGLWQEEKGQGKWEESGWEDSSGVVGTMPVLRQRKKAWAEWQFAAATERNRIRGEHDRKAVQRELMHRRWLRSLSKTERKKHLRKAKKQESLAALRAEKTLLELHSDLVSALQVGNIDIPRAVSVLKSLRDVVLTQRLLTDQPAVVYTLEKNSYADADQCLNSPLVLLTNGLSCFSLREFAGSHQVQKLADRLFMCESLQEADRFRSWPTGCSCPAVCLSADADQNVREFPGSRQVQKLADRLFMSCRVPFMVYEGETFLQAFERSRKNLLEKDARILEEKLGRKADRALKKMQETAEDQVVPGEQPTLPNPIATQDTEAVVPGL